MKISNISPNRNFGWNIKTHSLLTKSALEYVPELIPVSKTLCLGSQFPDIGIKYTGMFNSAHNYFGKGAMEYDYAPQNAFDMFLVNLSDAGQYLRDGMKKMGMFKAALALHFLQDMSVPLHTHQESVGGLKIIKHVLYELKAKKQEEFVKGLVPRKNKPLNLYDNFINTYEKSATMQNPFEIIDKQTMEKSVKDSLQNGFDATYNFLHRLNEIINSSDRKISLFNDFSESDFIRKLLS